MTDRFQGMAARGVDITSGRTGPSEATGELGPAGMVAFAFVLPHTVPLSTDPVPIHVEMEYLRKRGVDPAAFDHAWMYESFTCVLQWTTESQGVDPVFEGSVLASSVLARATGKVPRSATLETAVVAREQTAVVVMVPVKSRGAGLTPPHDGKVDPLTMAHWLVADSLRSIRIASSIPLPELRYQTLNPIIPAVFGAWTDTGALSFDEGQQAILLDHLPVQSATWEPVEPTSVANVFTQLTTGRISALIRDHAARSHVEHLAGDYRASVLSSAITCEVLLDSLLAVLLWEEGETPAVAAQVWGDATSITHRVKTLYASRLGGVWHLEGRGGTADWRRNIVEVRNSIIHSGRTPSAAESTRAGDSTATLTAFISKRLVVKWKEYPKSLAVLCGPSSVEKHASKKQRARTLESLQENAGFAAEFDRWRDDWLRERSTL